jgi:hypothetical protein
MSLLRRGSCTAITCLLLLCVLSGVLQVHFDFEHDDAYISYRYAWNWTHGLGPVYNRGERVEGYSNFLWVALLAVASRIGLDIVDTSRMLGTLSCFALVCLTYFFLSRVLLRGMRLALAGAAAIALHAGVAVWARSGLETMPFTLVVLGAQTCFLREHARGARHVRSGILFASAALLRADGLVYMAATVLFLCIAVRTPRRAAGLALGFALLFVPWFLWRYSYYGFLLPNSYYLKTGGDLFQQLRGLHYTYNFVVPFGGALLFALPLGLLAFRDALRDRIRLFLGVNVILAGAYVVWVGGDHMPMARFFVPAVPAIMILLLETTVEIEARLCGSSARQRRWIAASLVACIVTAGLLPTFNRRRVPTSHAITSRTFTRQCALAGEWFRAHVEADKLLATAPAGAVAFHSRLRVVDMLGVNDLHIAHLRVPEMGHGTAGHEKSDLAYVLSRRPDLIFRGVSDSCAGRGSVRTYSDGSRFRVRCADLGTGPMADDFGGVRTTVLIARFEEREEDIAVDRNVPLPSTRRVR